MGEESDGEGGPALSAETDEAADEESADSSASVESEEATSDAVEGATSSADEEATADSQPVSDEDSERENAIAAEAAEESLEGDSLDSVSAVETTRQAEAEVESGDEGEFVSDETYDPIQDEEMPLAEHIEEMIKRLAVVLAVAGSVTLAIFPVSELFLDTPIAENTINVLWNSVLPDTQSARPRIYSPLALLLTKIKVASLGGLIVALPILVYESYRFMQPGLYPNERRYYLAAVPTSLVLAVVGVAFAYNPILPLIFGYFFTYTEGVSVVAFGLSKTFNIILALMGYFAVIFQIPLAMMLAIMMGVTTRAWLADRRLYFWGAFLGISFFFVAVDPTGMAPFIIATTMILLFEGTLFLLKWVERA